jgi:hypothetical protein
MSLTQYEMEQIWIAARDAYAEVPIAGWFAAENRSGLDVLIKAHGIKSVAEIGSFLGLSAVWFARRVEKVYCIDTWHEGATYESENNLVGTLRRWELPNDFFSIFRDNVMRSGVWHKITPIKGGSHHVAGQVPNVDLVYIDGDHSYTGCCDDIETYRHKAAKIICGDDYSERDDIDGSKCFGVIEAVNELLPGAKHVGPFWYWVRP